MQLLQYSAGPLGKHLSPDVQLVSRRQVLSDAVFADQNVSLYTRQSGLRTRCDVHGDLHLCGCVAEHQSIALVPNCIE